MELLGRRYVIWKPPGPAGGQGLRETPPQGCAGLQGQGSGGLQLPPPGEPKDHHSGAPPARGFRVFLDLCPHRLAPLSQGRIDPDSGLLTCSYHGWSFDGDGLCRRIPQAATPCPAERQARHLAATSLPVREAVG
ncbi:MAG: Rieske 2Fe-2S domain-containing protein, partial [Synechococcaceae cyanobacterium]|nr:Rieske 2Fe-2S domain-containing protein [Synechococcaceae cyanobacterium]